LKEQFVRIVQENIGIINSLCRAWYRHEEDRNDARQDIILQLWKSFPSFRHEAGIGTWIYRVGLNTILSGRRKAKRSPKSEPLEDHRLADRTIRIAFDDEVQLLEQITSSLRDDDKALLILHLEGYQHHEIATILGMKYSNVSTRLNRIRAYLRKKYKYKAHEPE